MHWDPETQSQSFPNNKLCRGKNEMCGVEICVSMSVVEICVSMSVVEICVHMSVVEICVSMSVVMYFPLTEQQATTFLSRASMLAWIGPHALS